MTKDNAFSGLSSQIERYIKKLPGESEVFEYSADEIDNYNLGVIMAHAEFEHFFEDQLVKVVEMSKKKFIENEVITRSLGYLLFRYNIQKNEKDLKLDEAVKRVIGIYRSAIVNNHGIKVEQLKKMLKFLGMEDLIEEPEINLINNLSLLSKKRGALVHTSQYGNHITDGIEPESLIEILRELLGLFRSLAKEISDFDK